MATTGPTAKTPITFQKLIDEQKTTDLNIVDIIAEPGKMYTTTKAGTLDGIFLVDVNGKKVTVENKFDGSSGTSGVPPSGVPPSGVPPTLNSISIDKVTLESLIQNAKTQGDGLTPKIIVNTIEFISGDFEFNKLESDTIIRKKAIDKLNTYLINSAVAASEEAKFNGIVAEIITGLGGTPNPSVLTKGGGKRRNSKSCTQKYKKSGSKKQKKNCKYGTKRNKKM